MFLLIATDYEDSYERRMSSRQAHLDYIEKLRESGKALIGAALTNDEGKMIGSILVLNMNQEELDQYISTEPYITNKVWEKWETKTCSLGPSFAKQFSL